MNFTDTHIHIHSTVNLSLFLYTFFIVVNTSKSIFTLHKHLIQIFIQCVTIHLFSRATNQIATIPWGRVTFAWKNTLLPVLLINILIYIVDTNTFCFYLIRVFSQSLYISRDLQLSLTTTVCSSSLSVYLTVQKILEKIRTY